MTKNLRAGALALALIISSFGIATPQAHAAVDRAIVTNTFGLPEGAYVYNVLFMDGSSVTESYSDSVNVGTSSTQAQLISKVQAAVQSYAAGQGYSIGTPVWPWASNKDIAAATSTLASVSQVNSLIASATSSLASDLSQPMYVNGTSKTGYYAVTASSTVSGGSGVVRFYVDTNGNGTGTAPSEIYLSSLSAQVWSAGAPFYPGTVTVDSNRKYIDIGMKQMSVTTATGLINLLGGGASFVTGLTPANAADGTVVNAFVLVKK
jgi:hypothetical protein